MNDHSDAPNVHDVLDQFDVRILRALQDEGRLTNQELADRVTLSPSQCSRRRLRLEEAGYIRGFRADLDPVSLGYEVLAYMNVQLSRHNRDVASLFHAHVRSLPEVLEAHAVAGEADYLLKVRVKNLQALAAFMNDDLMSHESVSQLRSTVVLQEIKSSSGLPI